MLQGNHVRIDIKGVQHGQEVNNTFDYLIANGEMSSVEMLTAFRAMWRASFLTLAVETYEVRSYDLRRLAGIFPEFLLGGPANFPPASAVAERQFPRWDNAVSLAGDGVLDVGEIAFPPLPSYACAAFRKVCGAWEAPDNITVLPLEKRPRGAFGLPALNEPMTEPTDGNQFTALALADLQAVGVALQAFTSAGGDYAMVVLSFVKDKFFRFNRVLVGAENRWVGTYAVAPVTGTVLSQFVSTRVSRKQTSSNLG